MYQEEKISSPDKISLLARIRNLTESGLLEWIKELNPVLYTGVFRDDGKGKRFYLHSHVLELVSVDANGRPEPKTSRLELSLADVAFLTEPIELSIERRSQKIIEANIQVMNAFLDTLEAQLPCKK